MFMVDKRPVALLDNSLDNTQSREDKINQFISTIYKLINDTARNACADPTKLWQRYIINFLKEQFFDLTNTPQFTHGNNHFPFALCLTGSNAKGLGTPLGDIDVFIIAEHEKDVPVMQRAMGLLKQLLSEISEKSNSQFMQVDPVGLDPVRLCGTPRQLFNIMSERDFKTYVTSMLSAKTICGNKQLLSDFQNQLKLMKIDSGLGKTYSSISSFYYHEAVYGYSGPNNKDKINIKRDILRPITFMLDALKFELNLQDAEDLTDPCDILKLLEDNGHISPSVAALFEFTLNKLIHLRWSNHIQSLKEDDTIQLNDENRNAVREVIDAVAILRGIAQRKIVDNGRTIDLAPNESQAFKQNLNSAVLPYVDNVYNENDKVIDVKQRLSHHTERFFSNQIDQFSANVRRNVDPSRIFNGLKSPMHYTGFEDMFLSTIDTRTCKINQDKFNAWLWCMINDFAVPDLFDGAGNVKQYLIMMMNKDGWYESNPDKNILTKKILYSFLMNLFYINHLANNSTYLELSNQSQDIELPENYLVQQLKKYFNEFFENYIFPESVKLSEVINPQQLSLHLLRLLEAEKTNLDALRIFLGQEKISDFVAYLLTQGDVCLPLIRKYILNIAHDESLTLSEIAKKFGANNCERILENYVKCFEIADNECLLESIIINALDGDKVCKKLLEKLIATANYNSPRVRVLFSVIENKLKQNEFSVGVIQELSDSIFRTVVTYVFSLPEAKSFILAQQIVKKIHQADLGCEQIATIYRIASRNKILTLYFQQFNIINKPNLLNSIISNALRGDVFLLQNLNSMAARKDTEDYVMSALARFVTDPTCQTSVVLLRQYLSPEVFSNLMVYCFDLSVMPAGNRICQQISAMSDVEAKIAILIPTISTLIRQSKITLEQVKQTLGDAVFQQLITAIFKLDKVEENPFSQKIVERIAQLKYTYDQISEHFGAANTENILNCYFRTYMMRDEALSTSIIRRALANDNYCIERLKAQFNIAQDQIIDVIALQLVNELNAGKTLDEITTILGKERIHKIIAHILKKPFVVDHPLMAKVFAKITDAKLSLLEIADKFGLENRNELLRHYFESKNSPFNWPLNANFESKAQEIGYKLVRSEHWGVSDLAKLTAEQMQRLNENCFAKYFDFNPENAKAILTEYLKPEVQNYHILPLRLEGLIVPEVYKDVDHTSLEYAAYKTFAQNFDWKVGNPLRNAQVQNLERLLANKHFKAIKEHVFEPIDQEVDRLNNARETLFSSTGVDKAMQMVEAKIEIKNLVSDHVNKVITNNILKNNPVPNNAMSQLLNSVVIKVEDIAQRDEIACRRNKVGTFFKGLLGVLIALPLFFTPLFSRNYRDAFFKSESTQRLNSIRDNLEDQKLLTTPTPARGR